MIIVMVMGGVLISLSWLWFWGMLVLGVLGFGMFRNRNKIVLIMFIVRIVL